MNTDIFLEENAKAANNESYSILNYLTVATGVKSAVASNDTQLAGEIGSRISVSNTRNNNSVTFSGIRSAAVVQNTVSGDTLTQVGFFNTATASTSDPLLTGVVVSGITQTTNFDIEVVYNLTYERR